MKSTIKTFTFMVAGLITLSGCQAHSQALQRNDQGAMISVAQSLSGQPLTDKDLKRISNDLRTNPKTQSAVESVTKAVSHGPAAKYCPVDGKRFSADQTICPEHGVELKPVEN